MKITHVLLTTDISDDAKRAFEPALELARSFGARVTVLSVVPDMRLVPTGAPVTPMGSWPDLKREIADVRRTLEEQCADMENVEIAVVGAESPAKGVVDYAKQHDVDLIAISTHGRTGFRRLALGSVAEVVLRTSPVPVLSFPRPQ